MGKKDEGADKHSPSSTNRQDLIMAGNLGRASYFALLQMVKHYQYAEKEERMQVTHFF